MSLSLSLSVVWWYLAASGVAPVGVAPGGVASALDALLSSVAGAACAEEPQASGLLKVRASAPGAEVYLDGALIGTVPLTAVVPAGPHQIRVVADNFDPYVRKVDIQPDRTTELQASLIPGSGTVEFTGPPGARLWVDGKDKGDLPIRLRDLAPGAHDWRVEAPLHEPATGVLTTAKGRNYLLNVEMASSAGVFVVESTPPGATVVIDGEVVGVTPLRLTGVAAGDHDVRVELEGYATVLRAIDTTDGRRGEVIETLSREGGRLTVKTGAEDAQVYVNDVYIGEGKKVKGGPYEDGRARIRVVSASGGSTEGTVSIPAGGAVQAKVAEEGLIELRPLHQRWGFWVVVGGVAAAGGGAAIAAAAAAAPDPVEEGDQILVLP